MSKRALEHLRADPALARVIAQAGPVRITARRLPPFQSLVHAIIHQQLSGSAAKTILGRFLGLFAADDFPSPAAVAAMTPEKLRGAGLSGAKVTYVQEVARHTLAGAIPSLADCQALTDAELIARLTAIKGVGRWTAEMFLMFNLGRPDVLPVHDLGVRRGYQIAYAKRKPPTPEQLQRAGAKWAPYRTTAALYLWRAADGVNGGDW